MQIKQINTEKQSQQHKSHRPLNFDEFVGQTHIQKVLQTAIQSAIHRDSHLWHILLSWPSGYGKTTMAQIVANQLDSKIHIITGYAISKPADIISVLTAMEENDILFIDEIHRLKPTIEEMLYIAMEDFSIDMVMPDGGNVRLPLKPFTLIWATTKPSSLSQPLKNRFVYNCHFVDYTDEEKLDVVARYLKFYNITSENSLTTKIAKKVDSVPREIHNLCVKIRDFLISHNDWQLNLQSDTRIICEEWLQIKDWWITAIHQRYLKILENKDTPTGLKTISLQLGINEETVENEIEPLLIKLGLINKTPRWRILQ